MVVELKREREDVDHIAETRVGHITAKCGTYDKKVWDVCNPMFKVANNVPLL